MKDLGVTYDNFLPQNLAKSREPREQSCEMSILLHGAKSLK